MAGGVRVLQPVYNGDPVRMPEIDTEELSVDGETRQRERVAVTNTQDGAPLLVQTVNTPTPSAFGFQMAIPTSVWTITHMLGYDPAGIVVHDDNGNVLDGWTLQYLEPGVSLRLGFDIPSAGTARLS